MEYYYFEQYPNRLHVRACDSVRISKYVYQIRIQKAHWASMWIHEIKHAAEKKIHVMLVRVSLGPSKIAKFLTPSCAFPLRAGYVLLSLQLQYWIDLSLLLLNI